MADGRRGVCAVANVGGAGISYVMRFVGVIPARFSSTRLPGKPLLSIAGKPLIQWVYQSASRSRSLERLLVATDDERIMAAVEAFGGEARMTRSDHLSGTDRVAEVAAEIEADVFINIQGDEPLIAPATIDAVCAPFRQYGELQIATARIRMADGDEAQNPHVVKVVTDQAGRALYFSRSPIPHPRRTPVEFFKHIGIYAYRREFLLTLSTLRPSPLEYTEALEQLRFLDNGYRIQAVEVQEDSVGIDTPEDVRRVERILEHRAVSSKSIGT